MSGVVLHTPEQVGDMHCRRLWGVLGTAGQPVVHYCVARVVLIPGATDEHKGLSEISFEHGNERHRCGCGASTHEQGARLICRFRESGQDPCARVIESVEQMPAGQRSMPCGHPVVAVGRGSRRR